MTNLVEIILLLLSIFFILTDAQFWSGGWNDFNNFAPRNTGWLQTRRRTFLTDDDDDDDSWRIRSWGRQQRTFGGQRNIWSNDDSDDDSWRFGQRRFRIGDSDDSRWRFRSDNNDDNRWQIMTRQRRNFWDDSDDEDDSRFSE